MHACLQNAAALSLFSAALRVRAMNTKRTFLLALVALYGCGVEPTDAPDVAVSSQPLIFDANCHYAVGATCYGGVRTCATCFCQPVRGTPTTWPITPERCFASVPLDDDCDGAVDEGCPTAVQLGPPVASAMVGGSGGGDFSQAIGALITSVRVQSRTTDTDARYLTGVTSEYHSLSPSPFLPLSLDGNFVIEHLGADPSTWLQTIWFPVYQLKRWSTSQTMACPEGQVVIGIEGHAGGYVDQISGVRCATPQLISLDPTWSPGSFTVWLTQETLVGGASVPEFQGFSHGGQAFSLRCPQGSAAVGWFGRQGSWFDALGMYCAQLQLR